MSHLCPTRAALAAGILSAASTVAAGEKKPDFPPFDEVSEGYTQVVSTTDGKKSLYTIWHDKKRNELLAELPSGWNTQKHFFAMTQASGGIFAGLQGPVQYTYWKRYDKRLALVAPEIDTRSQGEPESRSSVDRLFTDRVLLDVPIVAIGPGGQPVIDLDNLLIGNAEAFAGARRRGRVEGLNTRLAEVTKVKAFPENVEVAIEVPTESGNLTTLHYSISLIPDSTGYKPRMADERVGYFMTVFRDLGQYDNEKKWVRYIDRWHLEKRDPKLRLSPPKEPIVFYIEHTVPVRYRRYIREGIQFWNEAFANVGLDNAIEVQYQDKNTNAHMEKDPEDVRYNFIRWLNNDISTAIGPHRAHPLTGQILDADVVLTDGWIRAYWGWYYEQAPEILLEGLSPDTLSWLDGHPDWDPRLLLASPAQRERLVARRAERQRRIAAGEDVAPLPHDPALLFNEDLAAISEWVGGQDHLCLAAHGLAFDMAFGRLCLEISGLAEGHAADAAEGETLDGIPEWFVGPFLRELVAHEVGHTLGLRHNFKASSIYTLEQINSEEWKGKKPLAGSVMDYLPPNFNKDAGEIQGDFTMIGIGPYDHWAIEYGYTFGDTDEVLKRVSEPELAYLTDDDTSGPDPLARRYDFSANPYEYAENQMRIVDEHRTRILEKFVADGDSWSKARRGYDLTLSMQLRMLGMMGNWVGGAHVHRDRKGDPGDRSPVNVVDAESQRAALDWVIRHCFVDEAYALTPELLAHMTVDKWSDDSPGDRSDPTWPVHDRIIAIQASMLTMIMNPQTLSRVLDNEYRTPADADALTLPDVMMTVANAVYSELDTELDGDTFTNREPMISSLRRNLQSAMTDRLIGLSGGDARMPRAIRTLAIQHLRRLEGTLGGLLDKRHAGQIDGYTLAHLEDLNDRVEKALNRIYVSDM